MNNIRLRIGVQGRVLWQKVKLTPIAVTMTAERSQQIVDIFKNELHVWDGKELGGGFTVFVKQDPAYGATTTGNHE